MSEERLLSQLEKLNKVQSLGRAIGGQEGRLLSFAGETKKRQLASKIKDINFGDFYSRGIEKGAFVDGDLDSLINARQDYTSFVGRFMAETGADRTEINNKITRDNLEFNGILNRAVRQGAISDIPDMNEVIEKFTTENNREPTALERLEIGQRQLANVIDIADAMGLSKARTQANVDIFKKRFEQNQGFSVDTRELPTEQGESIDVNQFLEEENQNSTGGNFVRGIASGFLTSFTESAAGVTGLVGGNETSGDLRSLSDSIREGIGTENTLSGQTGELVGQVISFLVPGTLIAKALGAGAKAATAIGAVQGSGYGASDFRRDYERVVEQEGGVVDEDTAQLAEVWGGSIGLVAEMAAPFLILRRLGGSQVDALFKPALKEGVAEASGEVVGGVARNLVAANVIEFDKDREAFVASEQIPDGLAGGAAGAAVSMIASIFNRRGLNLRPQEVVPNVEDIGNAEPVETVNTAINVASEAELKQTINEQLPPDTDIDSVREFIANENGGTPKSEREALDNLKRFREGLGDQEPQLSGILDNIIATSETRQTEVEVEVEQADRSIDILNEEGITPEVLEREFGVEPDVANSIISKLGDNPTISELVAEIDNTIESGTIQVGDRVKFNKKLSEDQINSLKDVSLRREIDAPASDTVFSVATHLPAEQASVVASTPQLAATVNTMYQNSVRSTLPSPDALTVEMNTREVNVKPETKKNLDAIVSSEYKAEDLVGELRKAAEDESLPLTERQKISRMANDIERGNINNKQRTSLENAISTVADGATLPPPVTDNTPQSPPQITQPPVAVISEQVKQDYTAKKDAVTETPANELGKNKSYYRKTIDFAKDFVAPFRGLGEDAKPIQDITYSSDSSNAEINIVVDSFHKELRKNYKFSKNFKGHKFTNAEIDPKFGRDLIEMNALLRGKSNGTNLPKEIKEQLIQMRDIVNRHQGIYIKALEQKIVALVNEGGADVKARRDLLEMVKNSVGTWMHRSYRAFETPSFMEAVVPGTERFDNFVKWLEVNDPEVVKGLVKANVRATNIKDEILSGSSASLEDMFIRDPNLTRLSDVFKKRKDVPQEFRDFLGEITDPVESFSSSVQKLNDFNVRIKFANELVNSFGPNSKSKLVIDADDPLRVNNPGEFVKLKLKDSPHFESLSGMYMRKDFHAVFRDTFGPTQTDDYMRMLAGINGAWRWTLTVAQPAAHLANFVGNIPMAAGYALQSKALPKAMAKWHDLLKANAADDYTRRLIELGVMDGVRTGQNAVYRKSVSDLGISQWMRDTVLNKDIIEAIAKDKSSTQVTHQLIGDKVLDFANRWYRQGDAFPRLVMFEGMLADELRILKKTQPNLDPKAANTLAEQLAAKKLRDRALTYSMVGRGVQTLNKYPVPFGAFVSYSSEVIRVSYNTIDGSLRDMGTPGRRAIGLRDLSAFALTTMLWSAALKTGVEGAVGAFTTDEIDEEQCLKDAKASRYYDSKTMACLGNNQLGHSQVLDMNRLNYLGGVTEAIDIARSDLDNKPGRIAEALLGSFYQPNITGELTRALTSGKDKYGRQIGDDISIMDVVLNEFTSNRLIKGSKEFYMLFDEANPINPDTDAPQTFPQALATLSGVSGATINPQKETRAKFSALKRSLDQDVSVAVNNILHEENLSNPLSEESINKYVAKIVEDYKETAVTFRDIFKDGADNPNINFENALGSVYGKAKTSFALKNGVPPFPVITKDRIESRLKSQGKDNNLTARQLRNYKKAMEDLRDKLDSIFP